MAPATPAFLSQPPWTFQGHQRPGDGGQPVQSLPSGRRPLQGLSSGDSFCFPVPPSHVRSRGCTGAHTHVLTCRHAFPRRHAQLHTDTPHVPAHMHTPLSHRWTVPLCGSFFHGQGLKHTLVRAHTHTQIRNPEVSLFLVRAHGPGHPDLCYQPRRNTGHPPRVGFLEGSLTALLEASEGSHYKPWGLSGYSLTSRPAGLLVRAACADPPPSPTPANTPRPLSAAPAVAPFCHFASFLPIPQLGYEPLGGRTLPLGLERSGVWTLVPCLGTGKAEGWHTGPCRGPGALQDRRQCRSGLLPGADSIRLPPDLICPWPLVPRAPCPGGHRATAVRSQPSSCCRLVLTFASDEK